MTAMTREQQIAELRAQGLSWRKVGRELGVSGQRAQELVTIEQYWNTMRAWGVERGDRLGGRMVRRLVFAGLESPDQVAAVSDEELAQRLTGGKEAYVMRWARERYGRGEEERKA